MVPGICSTGLPKVAYCPFQSIQKKMARTQSPITVGYVRVARVEPDGFLDMGDSRFRLTQPHQRLPELEYRERIIAVESDRRLGLIFASLNRF